MKRGITIASLAIYVVIFFSLTILATTVTTNFNRNILQEKADIIINEQIIKLQSNLLNSAKDSVSVSKENGIITFSNGDIYYFDSENNNVIKNGGVLLSDAVNFEVIQSSEMTNNIIEEYKAVAVYVEFEKYDVTDNSNIFVCVGDELYE